LAVADGSLGPLDRDVVLAEVQGEVAVDVLRRVDVSVASLNRALGDSAQQFDAYQALLESLAERGQLDRKLETLPTAEEMAVRRANGAGLLRPELAVLLAHAKSALACEITSMKSLSGPLRAEIACSYFPATIRTRFGHLVSRHWLFSQLVATIISNEIVDHMGMVWAHETATELGRQMVDVVAAFWAARQIIGAGELWAELELLTPTISSDADDELHGLVAIAVGTLARHYLLQSGPIAPEELIAADGSLASEVLRAEIGLPPWFDGDHRDAITCLGVDSEVAARFVLHASLAHMGEAGMVARASGCSATNVFTTFSLIDRVARLDRLVEGIRSVGVADRWKGWQAHALLDEIDGWRRSTAQHVLLTMGMDLALESVNAWESNGTGSFDRSNRLLEQLDSPSADKLTVAALVLRALRAIP